MTLPSSDDLRNHVVLGALDQYSLERLLQVARVEQLRRHEAIFSVGDRAERVLLVLDGAVKITASAANAREVILDLLGQGEMVGDEALTDERRSVNAIVLRDARLLSFPVAAIRTLWSRNADFASAWIRYVSSSRQRLHERIAELAYGNIEDRLLRVLVHLARYHGARTKKGNTVLKFPLTHQELANLIGATRETTTLAVNRLKETGTITLVERKIVMRDKNRTDVEEKAG